MIWLSFAALLVSYVVRFRTPIGVRIRSGRRTPAGGGHGRDLGLPNEVRRRGRLRRARRLRRRIPALIFGKWRPFGAFAAALLFGFSSALGDRLPEYFSEASSVPVVFNTLPYVLTLIAVAGVIGRSIPPAAIGRPYVKQ